ncbi:MAG: ATP-binding protein [Candidatus Saccharimonadaceae bacterium]|nr:ATP-binding protein [Candidatus Saccharimonadaceae bacterium]
MRKMHKGGPLITPKMARIFRFFAMFIPIILLSYGLLIHLGYIESSNEINLIGLFVFTFWWLCVLIIQFLFPVGSKFDMFLRLLAVHLLVGSYLLFYSGIVSPFIGGCLLMMLASYLCFSYKGLHISTLSFLAIVFFDILAWNQNNILIVKYDLLAAIAILITNILILSYTNKSKGNNKAELIRSKARESLQQDRISTIINNMTDALISTDANGNIVIYNAASLNILDTNISLEGHSIDEILPLTDQSGKKIVLSEEFKKAKTTVKRDDLDYKISVDEKMRLEVTFSPIRSSFNHINSIRNGYIILMRDITKAKSLEEERDEFISVVSHELRTPIAIAEGTISNVLMMFDHKDVTKKMMKDSAKTAHEQILFLSSMVNDLSTLSRAERGVAGTTELIDVTELAHKLFGKYQSEALEKKLTLNLDLSPKLGKVNVSRLYLEELLQNFITNAIKYTKNGSVDIIIKQENGSIKFAVKDSGVGISKSDQVKVFDKFFRSEDYRTRETGGTGLGLYIAAKLAHKMGVKIQLTSRLNFGSTFSFSVPEAKDPSSLTDKK